MENKYYTPEIKEFYEGFEHQIKNEENGQWYDGIHLNEYCNTISDDLRHKRIRVKYLDEQDILYSGFRYTNNDLDLIKITNEKVIRIRLRIINDIPHLKIYQTDEIFNKEQSFPIFVGKIKNKSEFKKLLKQLEITI